MPRTPNKNRRTRKHAIAGRRAWNRPASTARRPQPRAPGGESRLAGAPVVSFGHGTVRIEALCPTRLALAIHRKLLPLMDSDPETFPPYTMCHRLRRSDNSLMIAYGNDRHTISIPEARRYLSRLISGHKGRHDAPEESI